MLKIFSGVWEKKITPEIIEAYSNTLKGYTDNEIRQAGYKCMELCTYFPKPAEIISHISKRKEKEQYGAKFNMYSGHCQVCGKNGCITMKDEGDNYTGEQGDGLWKCRECYTGLTNEQINAKYQELFKIFDKKIRGF